MQIIRTKALSILPLQSIPIGPYCTDARRIGEHAIPFTFDAWLSIHDLSLSCIELNKNTGIIKSKCIYGSGLSMILNNDHRPNRGL